MGRKTNQQLGEEIVERLYEGEIEQAIVGNKKIAEVVQATLETDNNAYHLSHTSEKWVFKLI